MIIANEQKNGRGQYGKRWISYNGNLFVSFFYKLDNLKVSLKQITKINCLLVKKLLSIYYKKEIIFKKPNDLLINKKKFAVYYKKRLVNLIKSI
jgi:BirA family biotin operon repressor/biotin-[acetyl-CoA-carboxylase] ligase